MVSPHFAEMFSSQPISERQDSKIDEIELDVEYIIMKNILSIIHQCYNHGLILASSRTNMLLIDSLKCTFMVYTMFCFASEDRLNIPKVRELCSQRLVEIAAQSPTDIHFEVSLKMLDAKVFYNSLSILSLAYDSRKNQSDETAHMGVLKWTGNRRSVLFREQ